jgi:Spy/CpxP family protein refolding chaperone
MNKVVILLVLASSVAWSQPGHMRGHQRLGWRMERGGALVEKLKLSDDQKQQFDVIRTEFQKKQIAVRSKIQSMRLDLRELFRSEKPEKAKIDSQLSEISKLQNELKLNGVAMWFDVNKILTADQQKTWKERPIMPPPGRGGRGGRGMGMDTDTDDGPGGDDTM